MASRAVTPLGATSAPPFHSFAAKIVVIGQAAGAIGADQLIAHVLKAVDAGVRAPVMAVKSPAYLLAVRHPVVLVFQQEVFLLTMHA